MLTQRYLMSAKNLPAIMGKIVEGTAPGKFTTQHLKGLGFTSSNDRAIIPVLKDLGFLADDGTPTATYHSYRDASRSRQVLGQAVRDAYGDIFTINEKPTEKDRQAIKGKFRSTHNVSDAVAEKQTMTFYALLKLADVSAPPRPKVERRLEKADDDDSLVRQQTKDVAMQPPPGAFSGLRYNIEIHLPATKDVEVYSAIFKSLREHLIES